MTPNRIHRRTTTHTCAPTGNSAEYLIEEINCVLRRNKSEHFLRKVLARILILEELQ